MVGGWKFRDGSAHRRRVCEGWECGIRRGSAETTCRSYEGRRGFELIKEGKMNKETLEAVSHPLIAEEDLRHMYNDMLPQPK